MALSLTLGLLWASGCHPGGEPVLPTSASDSTSTPVEDSGRAPRAAAHRVRVLLDGAPAEGILLRQPAGGGGWTTGTDGTATVERDPACTAT